MAPLAGNLALLAMAVATLANVVLLDMARDSFDDRYEGCGPAMAAALPALNRSEFQKNPFLARIWPEAVAEWQSRGSPVSPLTFPEQAIAIMAYTKNDLYQDLSTAMCVAGRSPQEYRDKLHFKTLHFLLSQAVAELRAAQKEPCLDVFWGLRNVWYKTQRGDTVWFRQFAWASLRKEIAQRYGTDTLVQLHTCHGAEIKSFSNYPEIQEVLIPPYETFKVTEVTQEGGRVKIQLCSTGISNNYNCKWLKGGSVPSTHFHLGGLLLATTALAVATGIL